MSPLLYSIQSSQVDPYANLALEECLLDVAAEEGCCILYLWQNERTVVIGRNQNAHAECDLALLEADGGKLARRLSGGGAVYHDLGNLNFTFVVPAELWNLDAQTQVLLYALKQLGIEAKRSGRNDLTIDGRKFSGHAFYHRGDASYHHGTLMVDVESEPLARYLTASPLKLGAKGVASVRSRVINLVDVIPGLRRAELMSALEHAFSEVYHAMVEPLPENLIDKTSLNTKAAHYASRAWLLRERDPLDNIREARFGWGTIRLDWTSKGGHIVDCALFSDGLDADLLERIPDELIGITATPEGVEGRLCCIGATPTMARDIASLLSSH